MVRFGKGGKLSLRYIGPFEVLERVGTVAYRLDLTPSLSSVHAVFHVSTLWKYTPYPTNVIDWGELIVDADETFEEGPVRIMDNRNQVLRGKTMRLVKVLCQHLEVEEATWECDFHRIPRQPKFSCFSGRLVPVETQKQDF